MEAFKNRMVFSSERIIRQDRFTTNDRADLRIPELEEVWNVLKGNATLSALATVGQGLSHRGESLPEGKWTVRPYREGWGVPGFSEVPENLEIYNLPPPVSINLERAVIGRPRAGTTTGVPQALLNYHPVSRGPWRLKALIDRTGHAIKTNWIAIRPRNSDTPLEYLWALLNSPIANAFAYSFLRKMNILTGTLERCPLPDANGSEIADVGSAAKTLLDTATSPKDFSLGGRDEQGIRAALLRMDAAVLRLYGLPPKLERNLLELFRGEERKGVACKFGDYFPVDFVPCIPLHEYISEEYKQSTAGELAKRFQPVRSKAALAALDMAEKLATGE